MTAVNNDVPRFELYARYAVLGAGVGVLLGVPDLLLGTGVHVMVAGALALGAIGLLISRRDERQQREAVWDPLTGAANAAYFEARLADEHERATRHRYPLTLLVIELEGLTGYAGRASPRAATRLLRACVETLRRECRGTDLVARRREDELAIIAPFITATHATSMAERLHAALGAVLAPLDVPLTLSIGVAEARASRAADPRALIEACEMALLMAKVQRQRVFAHGPAPRGEERDDRSLPPAVQLNEVVESDGSRHKHLTIYCPDCEAWHAVEGERRSEWADSAVRAHGGLPYRDTSASETSVADVMERDVLCVRAETPLSDVARAMLEHGTSSAPVLDGKGRPVGVVTARDLLGVERREGKLARDVMTPLVFSVQPEATIDRAAALMAYEGVHRLVVSSRDGRVVGAIGATELMRWIGQRSGYVVPGRDAAAAVDDARQPEDPVPAPPEAIAPAESAYSPFPFTTPNPPNKILVIDDDEALRNDIAEVLREEGYAVLTAANGAEALARLHEEGPPALILLDLQMPVMNGWSFYSEVSKDPVLGRVPLVLLSATDQTANQGGRLDVDDFLAKPVTFNKLLGTVKQYC